MTIEPKPRPIQLGQIVNNPMSTQALQTQVQTVPESGVVEFVPFGGDSTIKLSVKIIREYVAVPTKQGDLPDDRECMRFLMLCRSRKLNPFESECFLIGYRNGNTGNVDWSLITAHQAFLKRATTNPGFGGMESGVIVKDEDGKMQEREGDFLYPGDNLLGAWAVVHHKDRLPTKRKVNLGTYKKSFGVWLNDPAGMIVKVAEADCLRSTYPTMLGGLYTDIERPAMEVVTTKSPDFEPKALPSRQPAKLAQGKAPKPSEPPQTVQEPPQGSDTPPPASNEPPAPTAEAVIPSEEPTSPVLVDFKPIAGASEALNGVLFLGAQSGVNEFQIVGFMQEVKLLKPEQHKLSDASEKKLKDLAGGWMNFVAKIKKMPREAAKE